jgi:sugar phosphate isomerase/epimerase
LSALFLIAVADDGRVLTVWGPTERTRDNWQALRLTAIASTCMIDAVLQPKGENLVANVSLSTMWMKQRFERPRDFFLAGVEMGFSSFELTAVATPSFFDDIHPGEFALTSIHDPLPGELDSTGLRHADIVFTSLDEERRQKAVEITTATIDAAQRYGAMAVILHVGQTDIDPSFEAALQQLFLEGDINGPEASAIRMRITTERQYLHEERMAALMRSMDEVIPYAAARSVSLGIETRRHIAEIPNFDEMLTLLSTYQDGAVGYWHDTGHAELQAVLGMTPHEEWLRSFGARLVGLHLHDCIGMEDHRAPGTGSVDWRGMASLTADGCIRTAEIKSAVSSDDLCAGIEFLQQTGWAE